MNENANPTLSLVLGIDAGGTGIRIALADSATGDILATAENAAHPDGGPAPLLAVLADFPIPPNHRIAAVCAGITKVSRLGVLPAWEDALHRAFPDALSRIVPDYVTAFHGALPGGVGVVVAAGTGSVAYGENEAGESLRLGGRGWEYGDEGSGAWLTTEVITRTVRACDGLQPASPLTDAVCAALGATDTGLLAEAARQHAAEHGRGFLTPLLLERARAHDPDAINMFVGAAGWLALLARTTARRLHFPAEHPTPIALIGGLREAGDLLTAPLLAVLHRHLPNAQLHLPTASPLDGALHLALRLPNRTPPSEPSIPGSPFPLSEERA